MAITFFEPREHRLLKSIERTVGIRFELGRIPTVADMREGLRRELLAQKVIEHEVTSKVTVTAQEVSDFFLANRSQFNLTEEAYHLAQIVVTPVREQQIANRTGDDAATPQAAASRARRSRPAPVSVAAIPAP